MTDLPGHGTKVSSDKKTISISHQRYKGGNNDYCSQFSAIFETISKILIVIVRLKLEKQGADGVTGPRREIYIRNEFDLKLVLKCLGCK